MLQATFPQAWAIDFEFVADPGERPRPVCMVAVEAWSGRKIELWSNELPDRPPFPIDESSLIVTFYGSAEFGCFQELGWPMPARTLDLYVEFRALTNGLPTPAGNSLLGALVAYGLPGITGEEKTSTREKIMRGGPWSRAEQEEILEYCATDVDATARLFLAMLPDIMAKPLGLGHALLRGRYTWAVAAMEHVGVPLDTTILGRLRTSWETIRGRLIDVMDRHREIYEGQSFRSAKFEGWLAKRSIPWPRLPSGALDLQDDTFREMSRSHPAVSPVRELRYSLSQLRLSSLAVGSDGRNRTLLSPFRSVTGRNQPSNAKFIFGPSTWLRSLIRPEPGKILAYLDWSQQEVGIAAALSGDGALIEAVESGDPYLAFAKQADLVPENATKETHSAIRDACKACVLGINYGMGPDALAGRIGGCRMDAKHLLELHCQTYRAFHRWADETVDGALLSGRMTTVFGWPIHVGQAVNVRSLRNWPMQAHGSEMLRLACSMAVEAGIRVCAPVHDALMIEAEEDQASEAISLTQKIMADASRAVLGGVLTLRSDVKVVRCPGRYMDPRGKEMWERMMMILEEVNPSESRDLYYFKEGYIEGYRPVPLSATLGAAICDSGEPISHG